MTPADWTEDEAIEVRAPPRRSDASDGWGQPETRIGGAERQPVTDSRHEDGWGHETESERNLQTDATGGRSAADVRNAIHEALAVSDNPLPISPFEIDARTSDNRINLADNVPAAKEIPTYDGYLDVVIHGSSASTQADISGERIDLGLEDTARLVLDHPAWDNRPIRLMSCDTGSGDFAQELSNRLEVPVYAPDGRLNVRFDGYTYVTTHDDTPAAWKRFEPIL